MCTLLPHGRHSGPATTICGLPSIVPIIHQSLTNHSPPTLCIRLENCFNTVCIPASSLHTTAYPSFTHTIHTHLLPERYVSLCLCIVCGRSDINNCPFTTHCSVATAPFFSCTYILLYKHSPISMVYEELPSNTVIWDHQQSGALHQQPLSSYFQYTLLYQ